MSSTEVDVFSLLKKAHNKNQLGHGLLLVSHAPDSENFQKGLLNFCSYLLCVSTLKKSSLQSCGNCDSCLAFKNAQVYEGAHPDLFHLRPELKTGYSVDQIKDLRNRLSLKMSLSQLRVILIDQSETLSGSAGAPANALLKILEEPRPATQLILLSSRPEGLLATIRSRCQIFRIPSTEKNISLLSEDQLKDWSELWKWIEKGAQSNEWYSLTLPANKETFFKEREEAYLELKGVFAESWERASKIIGHLNDSAAAQLLTWFHDFEEFLYSLKSHGQAGLQWSSFKTRAKSNHS